MKLPEYISKAEVSRVCKAIKIRDWSKLKEVKVTKSEAQIILRLVNTKRMPISVEDFRQGLEVELEHGIRFTDANVTNNHPVLTGMIVLAHLKETLDYYQRLEVAEIEGDLLKAVLSKNLKKITDKYKKLIEAERLLNKAVADQLK